MSLVQFYLKLGKRRCVGEQFSKVNLTIAIASLVQEFEIIKDEHTSLPKDSDVKYGFSTNLPPFKIIVRSRN